MSLRKNNQNKYCLGMIVIYLLFLITLDLWLVDCSAAEPKNFDTNLPNDLKYGTWYKHGPLLRPFFYNSKEYYIARRNHQRNNFSTCMEAAIDLMQQLAHKGRNPEYIVGIHDYKRVRHPIKKHAIVYCDGLYYDVPFDTIGKRLPPNFFVLEKKIINNLGKTKDDKLIGEQICSKAKLGDNQ